MEVSGERIRTVGIHDPTGDPLLKAELARARFEQVSDFVLIF